MIKDVPSRWSDRLASQAQAASPTKSLGCERRELRLVGWRKFGQNSAGPTKDRAPPVPAPADRPLLPGLTLILGGARSGKSREAERRVLASGLEPVYLATAEALDDEMAARIAAHRSRRGPAWRTIEEPLDVAGALKREAAAGRACLVDCLTLWLTNLMVRGRPIEPEVDRLLQLLPDLPGARVLVSNEVGQGVVPTGAMARAFVDHAGRLHQRIAERADVVVFMTAGLGHRLK
jgi:adenosylcobinamide kinase/adenosylcobinamide-phosphate guanylyltransferase